MRRIRDACANSPATEDGIQSALQQKESVPLSRILAGSLPSWHSEECRPIGVLPSVPHPSCSAGRSDQESLYQRNEQILPDPISPPGDVRGTGHRALASYIAERVFAATDLVRWYAVWLGNSAPSQQNPVTQIRCRVSSLTIETVRLM